MPVGKFDPKTGTMTFPDKPSPEFVEHFNTVFDRNPGGVFCNIMKGDNWSATKPNTAFYNPDTRNPFKLYAFLVTGKIPHGYTLKDPVGEDTFCSISGINEGWNKNHFHTTCKVQINRETGEIKIHRFDELNGANQRLAAAKLAYAFNELYDGKVRIDPAGNSVFNQAIYRQFYLMHQRGINVKVTGFNPTDAEMRQMGIDPREVAVWKQEIKDAEDAPKIAEKNRLAAEEAAKAAKIAAEKAAADKRADDLLKATQESAQASKDAAQASKDAAQASKDLLAFLKGNQPQNTQPPNPPAPPVPPPVTPPTTPPTRPTQNTTPPTQGGPKPK